MAKNREKRTRSLLPWLGFLLLLLAGLYVAFSMSATRSMNKTEAELVAQGRPLAFEELVPKSIPAAENAARAYEEVVDLLEDTSSGEAEKNLFGELDELAMLMTEDKPDPETVEAFRRLYQRGAVAEALKALKAGSMRPGYWSDLDFSDPINLDMSHLSDLITLSRILAATTKLQMMDGDQAGAWETLATSLRLANALAGEPTIVSQLVRTAAFQHSLSAMRLLDPATATAARLAEVRGLLRPFDNTAPFINALDGERILGDQFFQISPTELGVFERQSEMGFGTRVMLRLNRYLPPLRSRDRAARAEAMLAYTKAMEEPYSLADQKLAERIVAEIPPYLAISKLTVPGGFGGMKRNMTSMMAETRVMEAGLAAMEYRQRHGVNPPDLHSLGIENATDPFGGDDLVFESHADGITIRSLGANLADDGNGEQISWSYPGDHAAGPD